MTSIFKPNPTNQPEICKAIVFEIAGHLLALPVSAVFKVIRSSIVFCTTLGNRKLVHVEDTAFPILDLHHFLSQVRPDRYDEYKKQFLSTQEQFLVLARLYRTNLCAIPVDDPPSLMKLPLSSTYMLPPSYREKIGDLASHVTIVPYQDSTISVMLLDLQQALATNDFHNRVSVP
ncbi:MAG: hypothetical protein QNJ54_29285 [Prochloraceae cyanobacterium]|nr:hypothetical protein [Prochloraceae cyanobacterium]